MQGMKITIHGPGGRIVAEGYTVARTKNGLRIAIRQAGFNAGFKLIDYALWHNQEVRKHGISDYSA